MTKFKKLIASAELNEAHERIAELEAELAQAEKKLADHLAYWGNLDDLVQRAEKAEAALAEEREIRDAYVLKAEAALAEREQTITRMLRIRGLSDAPCDMCGYNGRGYYNPKTHPCAARADEGSE